MQSFKELRIELDEINFKADAKKLEISRTKIKNTEVFYHSEKKGSKKIRVWVKVKSAKEPEELGVFKDMNTAKKSATQFVKLMGEDIEEGLNVRKKIIEQSKIDDMIKEVNFLGEATLLSTFNVDKLARMTDMNRHNDSVKFLAQLLKRKPEEKIMDSIIAIHQLERSMHPALITYRTDIMKRLLKMADRVFSNAKDIHKAF
tara:strand:- start:6 stop:611 length:606 start_codon:yes stop_codon:yes gene_type:complete